MVCAAGIALTDPTGGLGGGAISSSSSRSASIVGTKLGEIEEYTLLPKIFNELIFSYAYYPKVIKLPNSPQLRFTDPTQTESDVFAVFDGIRFVQYYANIYSSSTLTLENYILRETRIDHDEGGDNLTVNFYNKEISLYMKLKLEFIPGMRYYIPKIKPGRNFEGGMSSCLCSFDEDLGKTKIDCTRASEE